MKFVLPSTTVKILLPSYPPKNDTGIGTTCTRSSTTYCGTTTCAKRSKHSGCGASTTSACLYSRRCTTRCSTLYTYRANPCEEVQVEQTITPCRVPVPTALDLPGRAVSDILRAPYPDSTGNYHHACHRDIDPQTPCLEMSLLNGGMWKDR